MELNRNDDLEFPPLPGSGSSLQQQWLPIWPRFNRRQAPREWELVDLTEGKSELAKSQSPPEPLPEPNFFVFQEIRPQSFRNLHNMEPISSMPPTQPRLTTEPTLLWTSREPYRFVNITVPVDPANNESRPYILSIPVPISEFAEIAGEESLPTTQSLSSTAGPETETAPLPSTSAPGHGRSSKVRGKRNGQRQTEGGKKRGGQGGKGRSSGSGKRGRGGGGKSGVGPAKKCILCSKNKLSKEFVATHNLYDEDGKVQCPILRKQVCNLCGATGDNAHTSKYCPVRQQRKRDDEAK